MCRVCVCVSCMDNIIPVGYYIVHVSCDVVYTMYTVHVQEKQKCLTSSGGLLENSSS